MGASVHATPEVEHGFPETPHTKATALLPEPSFGFLASPFILDAFWRKDDEILLSRKALGSALHRQFDQQLLPKPSRGVTGFLPFPLNDGQRRLGLPELLHFALLDGLVLDKDDLDGAFGSHVLQASLKLQQSLSAPQDVVGTQDNQETATSLDEAQSFIRDN